MSSSVRSHRQQSTRLPRPWDSPGKSTGVGCHFLFQCMKVKSESEVAQSCLTLSDPMDCSLPGPSIHGIFQARVIEWSAIILRHFMLQERGSGLPRCLTVPDWEWEERRQNWRPERGTSIQSGLQLQPPVADLCIAVSGGLFTHR